MVRTYTIKFPEVVGLDKQKGRFKDRFKEVFPAFMELILEAGFSIGFIKENTQRFLNESKACLSGKKRVVFDLSDTVYIGLGELLKICSLGIFCHDLTNSIVGFIPPRQESLNSFLNRIGFYNILFRWGDLSSDTGRPKWKSFIDSEHHHSFESLLPISPINNMADVSIARSNFSADNTVQKLIKQAMFGQDDKTVKYITNKMSRTLLGEIGENINQHSMSRGFISAQSQMKPWNESHIPKVVIAVSDTGIGIPQSLKNKDREKYGFKKGYKILDMVIAGDIPMQPGQDRGGIRKANDLIRDTFKGEFHIQSYFTEYSLWYREPPLKPFKKDWHENFVVGTHIVIKIPKKKVEK